MTQTVMLAMLSMLLVSVVTAQSADPPKSPAPAKSPAPGASAAKAPRVLMKTSLGEITIELYPDKAPITVKNFLDYVDAKFYDGTIFHRVIPGFMI